MSDFFYRVKTKSGEIKQGTIRASSVADAAIKLEQKGYTVLEIREEAVARNNVEVVVSSSKLLPLTISEKKEFFNAFYFLYKSGLSILEIFKSIIHSSKNKQVRFLCSQIVKKIEKGKSLKEAMSNYSNVLGVAHTSLIVAGEESGQLDDVLSSIIQNINRQDEIRSDLISKLTYPVMIFFFAIAVGLFFKFFILKVFSLMGTGLSYNELFRMLVFALVKIAIIYIVVFCILFSIYKNKSLLNKVVNFVLNIRLLGNLMKNYYFANFFSVLGLAYSAGITAAESVYLANSVIKVSEINKKIKKAEEMMFKGCEMTTALATTGLFSNYAMSQVSAGEKAGELDKMLKTVSLDYEKKLETAVNVLLKLVEPFTILVVGIFVAVIAVNAYKSYYASFFSMF